MHACFVYVMIYREEREKAQLQKKGRLIGAVFGLLVVDPDVVLAVDRGATELGLEVARQHEDDDVSIAERVQAQRGDHFLGLELEREIETAVRPQVVAAPRFTHVWSGHVLVAPPEWRHADAQAFQGEPHGLWINRGDVKVFGAADGDREYTPLLQLEWIWPRNRLNIDRN